MNAKKEFVKHTSGKQVKCAIVTRHDDDTVVASLKVGHTNDDYKEFLRLLDFEYDSGYGIWTLEGAIWYAALLGTENPRLVAVITTPRSVSRCRAGFFHR